MQNRHNSKSRLAAGLEKLSLHKYQAVHRDCLDMIKQDVSDGLPYFLLGLLARDHKNFSKAIELLRRAIATSPQMARFHAELARTYTQLNQQNEAFKANLDAARLSVDEADVADTIGVIFSRTGHHERAIPFFEKAITLNADPANFHYNLGASLQFSGEFERAKTAYNAALERDPKLYRAWSSLISLSRQTSEHHHLEILQTLFEDSQTEADASLHIGHAIAKTLEDLGEYAQSLTWLKKAKQKKSKSLNHNIKDDLALFKAAQQAPITPNLALKTSDPAPIFIIGLPRTGTTLVDRILSSHPDVTSAGELNTFAGLVKTASNSTSNRVLDEAVFTPLTDDALNKIGGAYWRETEDLRRGTPRMTDKMPLNFFYTGLIHQALPNARIIALRRGAMDSCLSNYRQLFSTGFSYYNYSLNLRDTAQYYGAFDKLMAHWRTSLPPDCFYEINYEDIVLDQENQTRQLLNFCGLNWHEACLHFYENAAPVSTASSVQVRQPLYKGAIGRWQRYGTALNDLKQALGAQ